MRILHSVEIILILEIVFITLLYFSLCRLYCWTSGLGFEISSPKLRKRIML